MEHVPVRELLRTALICITLLVIAGCSSKEQAPPSGLFVISSEGKFSVILPDSFPAPKVSTKQVATEVGDINMYLHESSKSDGSAFIISYNDYPGDAFTKEISVIMDDISKAVLGNMDAKIEEQKDFTFEGHPARTLNFSLRAGGRDGFGRLQYFIARPRLYQMIFLALDDKYERDKDAIDRTFASFKLLK